MEINDPKNNPIEQGKCSVKTYILRRPVMTGITDKLFFEKTRSSSTRRNEASTSHSY